VTQTSLAENGGIVVQTFLTHDGGTIPPSCVRKV
jgi:hypothetical protein